MDITPQRWRLGKSEMKDWKAVVRNWERQEAKQTENVSGYCRQESGKGVGGYVDVKALMQAAKNTTALSCEERMALYNSRRGDLMGMTADLPQQGVCVFDEGWV